MATLTLQKIVRGGVDPTYASADSGGDECEVPNPLRTFVHVKNTDASPVDVTIKGVVQSNQQQLNDQTKSVLATTGDSMIPIANWEVDDALILRIEYASVTGVTVAVIQVNA